MVVVVVVVLLVLLVLVVVLVEHGISILSTCCRRVLEWEVR